MTEAVVVRLARQTDLDAVCAIEGSWATTPGWTRAQFERDLESERGRLYVAERGGAVAGYAALLLVPPEAQVTTVAVRPDLAGAGLGRRLLERLHAEAARAGCSSATLEVSEANARALRLYEALGYRRVGRRPRYYRDGSDALLMTLNLAPPG